ncbi:hypothetical protein PG993_005395 [Apiospora rasikravindrae]|uniref:Fungal N-terminal domain-containing protein n=1 Tax=Apiospora rasikravindrae TaxID=990691 RepID=A0ABR1TFG3_9PEZI
MGDALGAAGSIVGIVAFGLKLATTLQTYVETVADAEQTLQDIAFEVSTTASALKQLQDLIEADALATQENRLPVLNANGKREIESLGRKCETVYQAIVHLLVKSNGADVEGHLAKSTSIADLEALKTKTLFGKLKWPWVEKKIKKHQGELRWLKMSLLLHIQIAQLAQTGSTKMSVTINSFLS